MYYSFGKNKIKSHVQIFLGLCMAFCFILFSSNHITKADNIYWFGSFNNGVPVQSYTSSSYLLNMIQQAFQSSGSTYSYEPISFQTFSNVLQNLGLYNDFALWDINNPEWYVNISYYSVSGWSGFSAITLNFTKSNCLPSSNPVRLPSGDIRYSDYNNNLKFIPLSYRDPFGVIVPSLIGNEDNYSTHSVKYLYKDLFSTSIQGSSSGSGQFEYYPNEYYNYLYYYDDDLDELSSFQNDWNTFLSDSDIFNFNVYYSFSDLSYGNNLWYYAHSYNFGFKLSSSFTCFPIFSSFYTWDINDIDYSISVNRVDNILQYAYSYQLIDKGHEDAGDFWSNFLSYGMNITTVNYTPTPIPTFSPILTPTPFPTNIFNPSVTPINLPLNPIIQIGEYGAPWDFIKGILPILRSSLNSGTVRFFVQSIEYIYNSNLFFEVLLFLIPSICLLAFILGRLKRK